MHTSIRLDTPIELINVTPLNPLISKCQIKVCYVGDTPNRNRSIITKDVARQMANSLPGSPIVGFFNEAKGDFEEHNRVIDISNGEFKIKDTTRPYGFVDLNAKVWFAKYLDDDQVEREYLVKLMGIPIILFLSFQTAVPGISTAQLLCIVQSPLFKPLIPA